MLEHNAITAAYFAPLDCIFKIQIYFKVRYIALDIAVNSCFSLLFSLLFLLLLCHTFYFLFYFYFIISKALKQKKCLNSGFIH